MSDRGYTNDPFGYLPGALRDSQFIREGHNTYAKGDVKAARKALKEAKHERRESRQTERKEERREEHPVVASRKATRGFVKEARKQVRQARRGKSDMTVKAAREQLGKIREARKGGLAKVRKENPESRYNERRKRRKAARAVVETGGGYRTGS